MSVDSLYREERELNIKIDNLNSIKYKLKEIKSNYIKATKSKLKDANKDFCNGGFKLNSKNPFEKQLDDIKNNIDSFDITVENIINSIPNQIRIYNKRINVICNNIKELQGKGR